MDRTLVSYIVPAYNVAPYISRCIESLFAQTHPHVEIILVDDGTKDNLLEVIQPFLDRIHLIQTPNRGVSAARNLAFSCSRGEYVVFLDGDDFVEPTHAETLLCAIKGCSAAYCDMTYVAIVDGKLRRLHSSDNSKRGGNLRESLILSNIQLGCILFSRESFELAGGFDPCFQCGEDWDFVLKSARFGNWSYVPKSLTNYLVRETSVSANYKKIYEQGRMVIEKHIATEPNGAFNHLRKSWHHGFSMYVGHIIRQSIKNSGEQRVEAISKALRFCLSHPRFFYYTLKRYGNR